MVINPRAGYSLLILMVFISVLLIGMVIAFPVLETQSWREKEEELLFRGRQYVEAIRLYVRNNPGNFPETIKDLVESRYLRKAFPDPMTRDGKWHLVLAADPGVGSGSVPSARSREAQTPGPVLQRQGPVGVPATPTITRIMVVSEADLQAVDDPRIIGVVSSSPRKSFYIFEENETYDSWFFYYGRAKGTKPEIIKFGERSR